MLIIRTLSVEFSRMSVYDFTHYIPTNYQFFLSRNHHRTDQYTTCLLSITTYFPNHFVRQVRQTNLCFAASLRIR